METNDGEGLIYGEKYQRFITSSLKVDYLPLFVDSSKAL